LIKTFLLTRREGLSVATLQFYEGYLNRSQKVVGTNISWEDIKRFIDALGCSSGGKHAYHRVLRVFYGWLYSHKCKIGLNPQDNPMLLVDPPKVAKKILPSLTSEQVFELIEQAEGTRNKAIISLLAESGLRLSEIARIKRNDIDWQERLIKVKCKGNKEALAVFGNRTDELIRKWMSEHQVSEGNLWGIDRWGIIYVLQELKIKTGLPCNAHTFRRTFASLLAKQGIDSLHIMRLGRWETMAMVEHYTKSIKFEDSLKLYRQITEE
jgi:site-specific recombinase XerD